jgi:hypothetical protein
VRVSECDHCDQVQRAAASENTARRYSSAALKLAEGAAGGCAIPSVMQQAVADAMARPCGLCAPFFASRDAEMFLDSTFLMEARENGVSAAEWQLVEDGNRLFTDVPPTVLPSFCRMLAKVGRFLVCGRCAVPNIALLI